MLFNIYHRGKFYCISRVDGDEVTLEQLRIVEGVFRNTRNYTTMSRKKIEAEFKAYLDRKAED